MTEKELKASVKEPAGCYFLYGDEDYLKEHYTSLIRRAVITDESFADFNETVFDDESFSAAALSDAVASLPLMSDKKLICVKLTSYDSLPEREKKGLLAALEQLPEDTVLVISVTAGGFDAGSAKRPSSALKSLGALASCVELPLGGELPLMRWLSRHFAEHGLVADEQALRLMLRLCGRGMHRLSLEAEKVAARACAAGESAVTAVLVESTVSRTEEEDAFRLANSILSGDLDSAFDSIRMSKQKNESPVRVLASVTSALCDLAAVASLAAEGADKREIASALKLHEYRVGLYLRAAASVSLERLDRAVELCAAADTQMKSSSLGYIVLERLICSSALK